MHSHKKGYSALPSPNKLKPANLIASKAVTKKPSKFVQAELDSMVDTVTKPYKLDALQDTAAGLNRDGKEENNSLDDLESVKTPGEVSISVELRNQGTSFDQVMAPSPHSLTNEELIAHIN